MSVVHVQAQELLRKWREAAGSACAGATLTPEKNGHLAELCWRVPRGLQRVWKQFDDPLSAVRAAISQTPWASVEESDGAGSIEDAIEELLEIFDEIPQCDSFTLQPLNAAVEKERSRHAAQLAERDARIGELKNTLARRTDAHDADGHALMRIVAERDAALAKFRGLREAIEVCLAEMRKEATFYPKNSHVYGEMDTMQSMLDRFPDEPSEEGAEETCP